MTQIHRTAEIEEGSHLGVGVEIGPFSIVHSGTIVGDNSVVESHCRLGDPRPSRQRLVTEIGRASVIRSHSVIYGGSCFGDELETGHQVVIRSGTTAGKNLRVGSFGDIQGECLIGDYVRMQSNVTVGQGSKIGDFVWLFPGVVLTNDPHPPSFVSKGATIGDFSVISAMSTILPGVFVGSGAVVGAGSLVSRDVEPGSLVVGTYARKVGPARLIRLQDGSNRPAYPWIRHFDRGYPEELVLQLRSRLVRE